MKLPTNVLENIEYYEVQRNLSAGMFDEKDRIVLHFKPEPVLWGLFHRRRKKVLDFKCVRNDAPRGKSAGVYTVQPSENFLMLFHQLYEYFN